MLLGGGTNRVQGPAKSMGKVKTNVICTQQILNYQAKYKGNPMCFIF